MRTTVPDNTTRITYRLRINGTAREVTDQPGTTLLGILLHNLKLDGTKYGCGRGECGACTVHLDGRPTLSCQCVMSEIGEREVTTIEGLSGELAFALHEAWAEAGLRNCNRCQSGQIMRAAGLLANTPRPTQDEIAAWMKPHDCTCGAPARMVEVVAHASAQWMARNT